MKKRDLKDVKVPDDLKRQVIERMKKERAKVNSKRKKYSILIKFTMIVEKIII